MTSAFPSASLRIWLLVGLAVTAFAGRAAAQELRVPPLTTVAGNPRLSGKFVWADLVTDDARAARGFYRELFGWTFRPVSNYWVAHNDERPLCGIIQQPRPKGRPARARWFAYLSVANVERAQREVTKAGGRVLAPPGRLPDRGEQALFTDAEGAIFGVIKSTAGDPEDFLAEPGDWIWIQLLSRDAKKASEFYHAVGRYEVLENTRAGRLSDFVLSSDGYARATVRTIPAANTSIQPAWLPFVRVKSIAESVKATARLGGKVLIEPKPELFDGKVAVIADPTGANIGILEWQEGMLKGGQ